MTPRHSNAFNWTVGAIIGGGMFMGIMLVWQLYGLVPAKWCAVPVSASKLTHQKPVIEDCVAIVLRILDLKDHAIIGLLGVIGIAFLVMVVMNFKARITFSGPGGIGGSVGAADAANQVAGAATDKADEIIEGVKQ